MTVTKIVRYTTTPETAPENERLVREVFAELNASRPEGLSYTTFRLADSSTFVHVAVLETDTNPLASSPAFAEFQTGIAQRCVDGPIPADAIAIGSYRS